MNAGAFIGGQNAWTQAGGYFGMMDAIVAWYAAATGLLTPTTSYFTVGVGLGVRRYVSTRSFPSFTKRSTIITVP